MRRVCVMSALPPTADIGTQSWNVRFASKADIPHRSERGLLFDHLVGARQHRAWNGDSERLRGLEVDHEVKLRRLLDREFGGLAPLQYLNHEVCTQPKRFGERNAVRHQAASFRKRWKRCRRR